MCLYQFSASPSRSLTDCDVQPLLLSLLQLLSSMISCLYSTATTVTPSLFNLLSALLGLQKEEVHTSLAALLKLMNRVACFYASFSISSLSCFKCRLATSGKSQEEVACGRRRGRAVRGGKGVVVPFPSTGLCRASAHLPLRHMSEALVFINGKEAVTHLLDLSRSQLCYCLQNTPMKVLVGFLGGGHQ